MQRHMPTLKDDGITVAASLASGQMKGLMDISDLIRWSVQAKVRYLSV